MIYLIFLFSFLMLTSCSDSKSNGNGKKIYVDYHGVRYTRQHDGKLGRWALYADTHQSTTDLKTLCYNADLVLDNGKRDIAAVTYPLVGMQSNLDPHYIEYQILSAKTAKIDGFFIEWGFMEHENNELLKAMQKVAKKYDFEIGVNWCDGWLYYDWITKVYPEIDSREKKTEHYVKCYEYLLDSVFTGPTAPLVHGRPVFYLFGPGATAKEFSWVKEQITKKLDEKKTAVLRRWADWGILENDIYQPVTQSDEVDEWVKLGATPTAWLPARVRNRDDKHIHWDYYATQKDMIEFLKPFRDSIWNSTDSTFDLKAGFVCPGMDNRGCAGWGRGHFFYMPRNNGDTFRSMWDFCLENKDNLDLVFIASWSDYTEGHEIEPTIENGDRELRSCLEYGAKFKEENADTTGIPLPLQLFKLRKEVDFLALSKQDVKNESDKLDKIAYFISNGLYTNAAQILNQVEEDLLSKNSAIEKESLYLTEKDFIEKYNENNDYYTINDKSTLSLIFNEGIKELLNSRNYVAFMEFEYLDNGREFFSVTSKTEKKPSNFFGVVARIRKDNTKEWKKAKIELYKENILYESNYPAFIFRGDARIRNIKISYDLY